ncbi:MAG: CPBP family intramembrane glutamic endopeptidase [Methylococcales bacterium]
MNIIRTIVPCLAIPIITMLGIGLFASLLSPVFWSILHGEYVLEKVFQKTGLLLLTLSAIYCVRTSVFHPQSGIFESTLPEQLKWLASSWLIGVLILSIPLTILIALQIRIPDTEVLASTTSVAKKLIAPLLVGLLVALIEEYVFRGWLLGWLQSRFAEIKSFGQNLAIVTSAFYFAILHFLKPAVELNNQNSTLQASLDVFFRSLKHLFQHNDIDTLIALFLAGVLLAIIKIRFNHGLLLVIGIHAGWIFSIKTIKSLTHGNPASQWQYLVGQDGIVGYLSASWLALVVLGLIIFFGFQNKQHD